MLNHRTFTLALTLWLAVSPSAATAEPQVIPTWRPADPDNTLVIETTKGRIIVELRPEMAPKAVERVKLLAREHLYDGLKFHRVIDRFMAQTGDPGNVDGGKSSHANLKAEFTFRRGAEQPYAPAARPAGWLTGFIGSTPFQGAPDEFMSRAADHKVSAWGTYCPGVAGMGRGDDADDANSEFFLMRQAYPSLDKRYSVFGRVIVGLDVVRRLKTGEPVKDPDAMIRVQVLADIPASERPKVEVMDTRSPAFGKRVAETRRRRGADFSVCDVEVPARIVR
jgi:peptidylprolyl isomerase